MFLKYFKTVTSASKIKADTGSIICIVIICMINCLTVIDKGGWVAYIATLPLWAGIWIFNRCLGTPNMECGFPADHRKKLAYRFLSSLLMFFLIIFAMLCAFIFFELISWIFDAGRVKEFAEGVKDTFAAIGVYGTLFGLSFAIIMYSSGMLVNFMVRRRNRNIFLVCLCIILLLFYLITGVTYVNGKDPNSGPRLPFSAYYYGSMNLPWLFILFCFLFAFGMLGWAIYLGIRHYNPKKF